MCAINKLNERTTSRASAPVAERFSDIDLMKDRVFVFGDIRHYAHTV